MRALDAAAEPEVSTKVRAVSVEHVWRARFFAKQHQIPTEVAQRHHRAAGQFVGVGDLVPTRKGRWKGEACHQCAKV